MLSHRLPAKEGKIPGIVVRLNDQLIGESKCERLEISGSKILVDEHLTRKNANILGRARALMKNGIYSAAKYHNGKVWIREREDGPIAAIDDIDMLQEVNGMLDGSEAGRGRGSSTSSRTTIEPAEPEDQEEDQEADHS